jgi:hypothetical protein
MDPTFSVRDRMELPRWKDEAFADLEFKIKTTLSAFRGFFRRVLQAHKHILTKESFFWLNTWFLSPSLLTIAAVLSCFFPSFISLFFSAILSALGAKILFSLLLKSF